MKVFKTYLFYENCNFLKQNDAISATGEIFFLQFLFFINDETQNLTPIAYYLGLGGILYPYIPIMRRYRTSRWMGGGLLWGMR